MLKTLLALALYLSSLQFYGVAQRLRDAVTEMLGWRQRLLIDPEAARQLFCAETRNDFCPVGVFWLEGGAWVSACHGRPYRHHFPRYWLLRVECNFPFFQASRNMLNLRQMIFR